MKKISIFLFLILWPALVFAGGNTSNDSFSKSKKKLLQFVYRDHLETFYCGCPFDLGKKIIPSDRYTPKRFTQRSERIEWEHVVPAQAFGQSFTEWREGNSECIDRKGRAFRGRGCAGKISMEYRYMEADMYNIVPAVGEINGDRSNFSYGMIPGESREYGACDFEVQDRKAEPREAIRGDIARIYFYMEWAYPGHGIISNKNRKLFEAWDKADSVDAWEIERCRRIEKVQGNRNPFVKE